MEYEKVEVNSERWLDLKDLLNEEWRDIKCYEGLYKVSNYGRVKSTKNNIILKNIVSKGYFQVSLHNKGRKNFKVHRLVGLIFIPNPKKLLEINHIDGNKLNNRIDNLEWCTRQENQIHAYETELQKAVKVKQFDLNGNLVRQYKSLRQATQITKIAHLSECCNNKRKTAGGFIWVKAK